MAAGCGRVHRVSRRSASPRSTDGYYWFTVQTMDLQGRISTTLEGAAPSLKVIVDTQPPAVTLDPLGPRGNDIGVSWTVRTRTRTSVRPRPCDWSIALPAPPTGSPCIRAPALGSTTGTRKAPVPSRSACARAIAGNLGEHDDRHARRRRADQQPGSGTAPERQPENTYNGPLDADRKLVNSKRITLNYDLKEVGPSGVEKIELWYTQDGGRSLNKQDYKTDVNQKSLTFDVVDEGIYGITLLARSGVGLGDRPPRSAIGRISGSKST